MRDYVSMDSDPERRSPQFDREAVSCHRTRHRQVSPANGSPGTRHDECPAVGRVQLPPADDGRNGNIYVSQSYRTAPDRACTWRSSLWTWRSFTVGREASNVTTRISFGFGLADDGQTTWCRSQHALLHSGHCSLVSKPSPTPYRLLQ